MIRICTHNVKWFNKLFESDNSLSVFNRSIKKEKELDDQRNAVIEVWKAIMPDLIGVVEAPNTTTTTGAQDCAIKMQNLLNSMGWPNYKVCVGFISSGQQELAIVYNADKLDVAHKPGGNPSTKSNPPFDGQFFFDTDDDKVEEVYQMYRPPLEAEVTIKATGEKFYTMVVHAKSKGIFNATDRVHFDNQSLGNRRRLFAECTWIRNRVDEWLKEGKHVVVMGDVNDGPGMDYYEMTFGKSGVEVIIGDLFDADEVLMHYGGRPKWSNYGWKPSSTNFKDTFTGRTVNAQIDHVLASRSIPVVADSYRIWNPSELDEAKPLSTLLKKASDHYPVTLDLEM